LHYAVNAEEEDLVEKLLEHPRIDINAQTHVSFEPSPEPGHSIVPETNDDSLFTQNGVSPLHIAELHFSENLAKMLIDHGANIEIEDKVLHFFSLPTWMLTYHAGFVYSVLVDEMRKRYRNYKDASCPWEHPKCPRLDMGGYSIAQCY